ncbi:MAG: ACP S-malonyltransferase [Magnetovibrionaceae bacterium]
MGIALVFPGQGSQAVGMGKELAEAFPTARAVFEEVDDVLDQKLSTLMFEGPDDELRLTENAQPALMAVSIAVMRVLEEGGFKLSEKADLVAGHSLGEYSALAAAGTFSLAETARLLKIRGLAMQEAVPVGQGAMAALMGLTFDQAKTVAAEAAEDQVCQAANDNADGQVVISGHEEAIERALKIAAEHGARKSVKLPVSAPFHCALMQPAADAMRDALTESEMADPVVPLVPNVAAHKVDQADVIRRMLVEQVCGTVRWRESVLYMGEQGIDRLIEVGSGKVLSGLVRRINKSIKGQSVGSPADIEALLAE